MAKGKNQVLLVFLLQSLTIAFRRQQVFIDLWHNTQQTGITIPRGAEFILHRLPRSACYLFLCILAPFGNLWLSLWRWNCWAWLARTKKIDSQMLYWSSYSLGFFWAFRSFVLIMCGNGLGTHRLWSRDKDNNLANEICQHLSSQ